MPTQQLHAEMNCTQTRCPGWLWLLLQALGCSYDISGQKKVVLQDVWGKAEPGQMQVQESLSQPWVLWKTSKLCLDNKLPTRLNVCQVTVRIDAAASKPSWKCGTSSAAMQSCLLSNDPAHV